MLKRTVRSCPPASGLLLLLVLSFGPWRLSIAQSPEKTFARRNSFGIVAAFSNDSSHMLLGESQSRKLLDFGASYSRSLISSHLLNWQFDAEYLPLAWDSDPVLVNTTTITSTDPGFTEVIVSSQPTVSACHPSSGSGSFPGTGTTFTFVNTCTRRWVIGQAMSPVGFQWNFLPRHRLQPFAAGHGGYMYTSQPIPVTDAGTFNFTFDFGGGIEYFRTHSQSIRLEYRFHHISNNETAPANPGIDSGLFQVSYEFGR